MSPISNQKAYIVLKVTSSNMAKKLKEKEHFEFTEGYQKTLNWFFSFPNIEMSLNDLSHELKISKTTAKNTVNQLINEKFLIKKILGKTWRISCDQNHGYNFSRKISYNLFMVYNLGLIEEIRKLIQNPLAIILFGSYRKGDDNEKSDIDIAVEVLDDKEIQIIELGVIPKFGYRNNVRVNIHKFSRNKIDLNLFANIANGIVLEGFLEVRP